MNIPENCCGAPQQRVHNILRVSAEWTLKSKPSAKLKKPIKPVLK